MIDCLRYDQYVGKNILTDYRIHVDNIDQYGRKYLKNMNRFYLIKIENLDYFKRMLCFWVCQFSNIGHYCKYDWCTTDQISKFIICRLFFDKHYQNLRYKWQWACLIENYLASIAPVPTMVF